MKVLFVASGNFNRVSPITKAQGDSLIDTGIEVDYYLIKGKGIMGYLRQVRPLRKYLKEHPYDVVHAHYSFSAYVASLAGAKPLVVSLMGTDVNAKKSRRLAIRFFNKLFHWKDIIVKSEDMAKVMKIENVHIIPNGVDLVLFVPMNQETCQNKLGWDKGLKHILFPANPNRPVKDYPLAQEAVKLLNSNAIIHVFQDVDYKDTVYYYNAADVVLLTSKWEGSPNVIKEAMACCRPIVSTAVGDVKERMSGVSGCYVAESREVDRLVNMLNQALAFEGITKGREAIVKSGLDRRQTAERIIDIYRHRVINK